MKKDVILVLTDKSPMVAPLAPNTSEARRALAQVSFKSRVEATVILYISFKNGTIEVLKSRYEPEKTRHIVDCYKAIYSDEISKFEEERKISDEIEAMAGQLFRDVGLKDPNYNKFNYIDFDE